MGYQISKSGKTYRIIWQKGDYEKRNVPKDSREARELGFKPDFTYEEAKARAKQLRNESWVKEHAASEKKRTDVIKKRDNLRGAFLTDEDAEEFERIWIPEKRINQYHWNTLQKLIVAFGIHPSQWYKQSSVIYKEFVKNRFSPNYCKKLIRYLNMWGYYLCEKQNKAWKDVERLNPFWKRKVEAARKRKSGESDPLTPAQLESAKDKLSETAYNWLYISVWFGLRPREVDQLTKANKFLWQIEEDKEFGYVLHVFQEKLEERGTDPEKCWKYIPAVFEEQKRAIEIIRSKKFKKPIGNKGQILKRVFGEGVTHYGGRKNFTDMLRDAGYDLETVSKWMGHLSVRTTEKSYARNVKVFYRPPTKLKKVG